MRVLRPLLVMCSLLVAAMAAADHPSTLDHMLRQVKEANSREAALRAEREQGFLHAKADREQLLAEQRERVAGARAITSSRPSTGKAFASSAAFIGTSWLASSSERRHRCSRSAKQR